MAEFLLLISLLTASTLSNLLTSGVNGASTFTFVNKCDYTVWPGILSNAGIAALPTTGFSLQKDESKTLEAPSNWGGRLWGRTHCGEDSTGKFTCVTGDCGSGKLECDGGNAAPPATLAEFTLDGSGGMDFYDVSLVDGYNLPMLVVPQGGTGQNCTSTGCVVDLNGACPSELRVNSVGGDGVACKSACEAFGSPEYCCSGAYATPDTCKPSSYSELFKTACPRAYSYAYDDKTSTFTCAGADYLVTFCPSPNTSQKSSSQQGQTPPVASNSPPASGGTSSGDGGSNGSGAYDGTMVYEGALGVSGASHMCKHMVGSQVVAGGVAVVAAMWMLFLQHYPSKHGFVG